MSEAALVIATSMLIISLVNLMITLIDKLKK